jgi:hypothetical protein
MEPLSASALGHRFATTMAEAGLTGTFRGLRRGAVQQREIAGDTAAAIQRFGKWQSAHQQQRYLLRRRGFPAAPAAAASAAVQAFAGSSSHRTAAGPAAASAPVAPQVARFPAIPALPQLLARARAAVAASGLVSAAQGHSPVLSGHNTRSTTSRRGRPAPC